MVWDYLKNTFTLSDSNILFLLLITGNRQNEVHLLRYTSRRLTFNIECQCLNNFCNMKLFLLCIRSQ